MKFAVGIGSVSAEESELPRRASEPWLSGQLANGNYIGWLVEQRGVVVAEGGIFVRELGPVPGCYRVGRWGHIANLYTAPAHRRRGLAPAHEHNSRLVPGAPY